MLAAKINGLQPLFVCPRFQIACPLSATFQRSSDVRHIWSQILSQSNFAITNQPPSESPSTLPYLTVKSQVENSLCSFSVTFMLTPFRGKVLRASLALPSLFGTSWRNSWRPLYNLAVYSWKEREEVKFIAVISNNNSSERKLDFMNHKSTG